MTLDENLFRMYLGQGDVMTKWNNGPPPSCGWWPASFSKDPNALRWWNGKYWSWSAEESNSADTAAFFAGKEVDSYTNIQWQHRPKSWPARSFT